MATNHILPFATSSSANVLTDTELALSPEMQTGFALNSTASSALIGKLFQSTAAAAYAIGQITVKYANADVTGTDSAALAANFETAIKTIVSQTAAPATWGNITGTLTAQTDLQTALDTKQNASTAFTKTQADTLYIAASKESTFATTTALNTGLSAKLDSSTAATTYALKTELPDLTPYALTTTVNSGLAKKLDASAAFTQTQADALYLGINAKAVSATTADTANSVDGANVTGTVANATSAVKATQDASGRVIADTYALAASVYTKTEVDAKVSSVYKYKGSVANEAALPTTGQVVGDVYNTEDTDKNFAWDGTKWDSIGGTVDLSAYLTSATAASTYATQTSLTSGLSKKLDSSTASTTYATKTELTTGLGKKLNTSAAFTKTQADTLYLGKTAKAASAATADSVAGANVTGTVAEATHAVSADSATTATSATTAASATKATQDKNGKDITTQYVAKSAYDAKIAELNNLITSLTTRVGALETTSVNKTNATVTGSLTIE